LRELLPEADIDARFAAIDIDGVTSDSRKAERMLDWSPKVSTAEGVDKLLEWVRGNHELFGTW
jgi:nucleoside-diphosphate-sugar epimerase